MTLIATAAHAQTEDSTRSTASARLSDSVTVEERVLVTPDITGAEARRRAIEEGLAEGVRRVAGVRVQSNALSVLDERGSPLRGGYSSVVQLDAAARAVDYRVVREEWVTTQHPELGAQLYYRVKLLVVVQRESGVPDPGFTAELTLDAARYVVRAGDRANSDEMQATLRTSRSAFVTLFVITDDSVERVFPNEYVREVRAAADVDVALPPPDWRARGVRLRASLPAGRDHVRSLMLAVATLDAVPPPPSPLMSVLDMQRWLVRIPASRRALGFAAYEAVR